MTVKKSLCAEEEAFHELMKWAKKDTCRPGYLSTDQIHCGDSNLEVTEESEAADNLVVKTWDIRLQIKSCEDMSSTDGLVDIIDPVTEVVIAQNVEENIAKEICRRWNAIIR